MRGCVVTDLPPRALRSGARPATATRGLLVSSISRTCHRHRRGPAPARAHAAPALGPRGEPSGPLGSSS